MENIHLHENEQYNVCIYWLIYADVDSICWGINILVTTVFFNIDEDNLIAMLIINISYEDYSLLCD